jgi:ABC-type multidrug transport system ATPase subunit
MTQHEALWPEQTVYEALWFTGSLKTTRKDVSAEVLHKRIVRLLEEVGLGAQMRQKIGDPDVGGLSGRRNKSLLATTMRIGDLLQGCPAVML